MTLLEIFTILIIHWIADFILQTDSQAKGKSKEWKPLLQHTFNYSLCWLIPILFIFPQNWTTLQYVTNSFLFAGLTFIAHTITDYFTSRLNSKLWAEGKTHLFFVSIGFDQILHYLQLFLTYWILAGKN